MGKKFKRYVKTYNKACVFYKSIGADLTDEKITSGLTLEQKMNLKCQYFFRMHAPFVPATHPLLSGDEEEVADREEELIDLSEKDDVVDNQTMLVADVDEFYQTAMLDEDGSYEMGNQITRSAVDVEANMAQIPQENQRPQQSRGGASVQSVDDVRSSRKSRGSRDRLLPPERKTFLITTYEEQVKEIIGLEESCSRSEGKFQVRDPGG
ncbi:hypothetical protein R1sor_013376 [Riccia sorocarpa]|uniref:Uncharacterized protein n=1 Tax=Riccia sorocarpa TaxID=122646 RepID=A0ABD3H902_9MARC